jgi:uncharacterized membrane protein YesL
MFIEKPFFQKINQISDWILRLVIINTLVIITILPLITLFLGLSAGYNTLRDLWRKQEKGLFRTYFKHLKHRILHKLLLGLVLGVILLVGYLNMTYYVDLIEITPTLFYQAGYYITLFFVVMMLSVSLYLLPIVYTNPQLGIKSSIKLAFYVAGKYILRTLFILLTPALLLFLLLTSFTSMLFVLFGVSGWLMVMVLITDVVVDYIEEMNRRD